MREQVPNGRKALTTTDCVPADTWEKPSLHGETGFAWEKAILDILAIRMGKAANTVARNPCGITLVKLSFSRRNRSSYSARWITAFWHADRDYEHRSRWALDGKDEKDLFGHADGELGG